MFLYKCTGVRSCYDEGKRVAETLMFDYHRQHGIGKIYSPFPFVFFRPSAIRIYEDCVVMFCMHYYNVNSYII